MLTPNSQENKYTTFEFQLLPNKQQRLLLHILLEDLRVLYNAALQQRRDAWSKQKNLNKGQRALPTLYDQHSELTVLRKEDPNGLDRHAATICRSPLNRLDKAYTAFFRNLKLGAKAGSPRFKSPGHLTSFDFNCRPPVFGNKIRVPNLGLVRFNKHRDLHGLPVGASIKYYPSATKRHQWKVFVMCNTGPAPEKCNPETIRPSEMVGWDLGLKKFLVLSDGCTLGNPRHLRRAEEQLKLADQTLSRKKKGSKNRKKAKRARALRYEKLANQRSDFHCKVAKRLTNTYKVIVLEDLRIAEMLDKTKKNKKQASTGLRKNIADAGWGNFVRRVQSKAESAGSWCLLVAPTGTTQTCSGCQGQPRERIGLGVREYRCEHCRLVLDRDANASRNILARGLRALEAAWAETQVAERGASVFEFRGKAPSAH